MTRKTFTPLTEYQNLTGTERSQIERRELARGSWREGKIENALLILDSVTQEEMTPRVAAEVFATEAACLCALQDFDGALKSLRRAAPFLDQALPRVQGCFYFHRGLAYRNLGNIDAALTDYAGSIVFWQQAGDTDYEIAALNNLAVLYLEGGHLGEARRYIDRVFAVLTEDATHFCNAHDTLAKILLVEGHLVDAWLTSKIALDAAGENEIWQGQCVATREQIKKRLLEFMVPIVTLKDLKQLKVDIIRYALDKTGGSTVEAAKLLNTSHQLIAHAAKTAKLARKPARKKSIIKSLS